MREHKEFVNLVNKIKMQYQSTSSQVNMNLTGAQKIDEMLRECQGVISG